MTRDQTGRASVVLVMRADGRILAVSRGHGSNLWGLPGGKVEPDETFAQAASRELHEETGLTLSNARELYRARSRGDVLTAVFTGRVVGSIRSSEEGETAWLTRQDLTDPTRTPFANHAGGLFRALALGSVPIPLYQEHPMTDAATTTTMDLGTADVHIPSAAHMPHGKPVGTIDAMKSVEMDLNAAERKRLRPSQFADPTNRAYPIHDKAHADNAAARLEQQKGSMSAGKYASIKRRIKAAQRRFGEKAKTASMQGAAPAAPALRGKGFRMAINHPGGGSIHVRMTDESADALFVLPAVEIAPIEDAK